MSGSYKVGYAAKPVTQLTSEELDAAESICRSPNRAFLLEMISAYDAKERCDEEKSEGFCLFLDEVNQMSPMEVQQFKDIAKCDQEWERWATEHANKACSQHIIASFLDFRQ